MPLVRLLQDWASFTHDSILPEGAARLRQSCCISSEQGIVFARAAGARTGARSCPTKSPSRSLARPRRADQSLSARQLLLFLQPSTSAQRSRAWLAHEVDGVPVREIARQEWRPAATSYRRIRCARLDLRAALRRDEHSEQFQMTQRQRSKYAGPAICSGSRFVLPSPILVDLGRAPAVLLPRHPGAARWLGRAFVGRASKRTARGPRLRPASRKPRAGRLRRHGGAREGRRVGENAPC